MTIAKRENDLNIAEAKDWRNFKCQRKLMKSFGGC
jgi:hypothetical protein